MKTQHGGTLLDNILPESAKALTQHVPMVRLPANQRRCKRSSMQTAPLLELAVRDAVSGTQQHLYVVAWAITEEYALIRIHLTVPLKNCRALNCGSIPETRLLPRPSREPLLHRR